ncbi:MAG: anthranilate synthase component I family protein [Mucilaginibacter sp.]
MTRSITDLQSFKQKALQWASGFDAVCYLDSNGFKDQYSRFDVLLAIGIEDELTAMAGDAFEQLKQFRANNHGYITGFLGYELKNEIENLSSSNADNLSFPDLYFFAPKYLITIQDEHIEIDGKDAETIFNTIDQQVIVPEESKVSIALQSRFSKAEYLETTEAIKAHITRGDIYVTNFCQEFYACDVNIYPVDIFSRLNNISPNPFASFFKWKDHYIIGASPERFLAKRGTKLISQPIKGTAKRSIDDTEDDAIKYTLRHHTKELQENVMVVDLVRNDLTHSAKPGTVQTEELFAIHSFKQVHQMISTVVCELSNEVSPVDAIKNTFPMGSMTGAPKISAMLLMEQYERSKRGVYSGAVGYFAPDGDFDFNVVIRSLLYNAATKYLSLQVGSAITYHADPEQEYEECLLKAKAIMDVLRQS